MKIGKETEMFFYKPVLSFLFLDICSFLAKIRTDFFVCRNFIQALGGVYGGRGQEEVS